MKWQHGGRRASYSFYTSSSDNQNLYATTVEDLSMSREDQEIVERIRLLWVSSSHECLAAIAVKWSDVSKKPLSM